VVTPLSNNDVHQLAGHIDDLARRRVTDEPAHALIRQYRRAHRRLIGTRGNRDAGAHLAVHLYAEFDLVLDLSRRVGRGPGRINQRTLMTQQLPQGVADVRHDGRETHRDDAQGLLTHRAPRRADIIESAQRVQQLHHGRDGRVERVAPADIVGHLRESLVRRTAQCLLAGIQDGIVKGQAPFTLPTVFGYLGSANIGAFPVSLIIAAALRRGC